MRNVRRYDPLGWPVFVTLVCRNHTPLLASATAKDIVVDCLRKLRAENALRVYAWVVLDDHVHLLIDRCHPDFSTVVGRLKQAVVIALGKRALWQQRFHDHIIRDKEDLRAHVDYIHFNPRKHRLTDNPSKYRWSSVRRFIASGDYPENWGMDEIPNTIAEDTGSE
jgi:putative transposase